MVLIRKPGKNRLCLDSRKLNSVTKKDAYPIPNIGGLISRIEDTRVISAIDLKDAFFQIPLEESSKGKDRLYRAWTSPLSMYGNAFRPM